MDERKNELMCLYEIGTDGMLRKNIVKRIKSLRTCGQGSRTREVHSHRKNRNQETTMRHIMVQGHPIMDMMMSVLDNREEGGMATAAITLPSGQNKNKYHFKCMI